MTIPNEKNEVGRQNIQITSADFEKIKHKFGTFFVHFYSYLGKSEKNKVKMLLHL